MTSPYAELRAAALAATPGPWERQSGFVPYVIRACGQQILRCYKNDNVKGIDREINAAYIAAASPDVVLGLLDRIAELEAENEQLAKSAGWWAAQGSYPHGAPTVVQLSVQNAALRTTAEGYRRALSWFLEDERFHVAVGGNPIVVERMLNDARAALASGGTDE